MTLEATLDRRCAMRVAALGGLYIKLLGYLGIPDRLVILPGGVVLFVEFKKPGRKARLRPGQEPWGKRLERLGCNYALVASFDEFNAVLERVRGEQI